MIIKIILYQIHSISNSFISNNNERKNKTKMRATSAPPMNQISHHVLYTRQTKFIMAESNILQNQRFLYKKQYETLMSFLQTRKKKLVANEKNILT